MEKSIQAPQFGRDICEIGMYFGMLLSKGYNFDLQSTNIKALDQIDGKDACELFLDTIASTANSIAVIDFYVVIHGHLLFVCLNLLY